MKTSLLRCLATVVATSLIMGPMYASSGVEADILEEVNFLRTSPDSYAGDLEEYERRFDGRVAFGEGEEPDFTTHEGPRPVIEAVRELRRARPLGEVRHSDILAKAAADHVRFQGASGQVGHISNGKRPGDRVKARGGNIYVGEVIVYGVYSSRNAVRQLVVDDGVPGRGHRRLLMTASYRYAGVACGSHRKWRNMCVIVLSETRDGSPVMSPQGS
jgi:Cysteine-rich secretory protein family